MAARDTPATRSTQQYSSLIGVREAAQLASVSRAHVYRLIERREVEAYRVGSAGPIRVDRDAFVRWLYSGEVNR